MSCSSSSMLLLVLFAAILFITLDARVIYSRFDASPDQYMEQKRGTGDASFDYDANQIIRNTMKRNRQCLLNAGLSQGCDLSDMLHAQTQARKFMSFAGPGK